MKSIQSPALLAVIAAAGLTFGSVATSAAQTPTPQDPASPPQAEQQRDMKAQSQQAQGRLISVDPDASTLTVETANGDRMEFTYNESTEVSGSDEDVAGLAPMAGANVTIHYTADQGTGKNTATRIEVTAQK
ncbi:MAG: hypothetical protein AB7O67_16090 [Vicinamibacterales bacterium]